MSFDDCHDFLVHALSCQNRSLTLEQFSLLSNTLFHLSPTADWLMYVAEYVSSWRSFTDTQTVQDTLPKLQTYKGNILLLFVAHYMIYRDVVEFDKDGGRKTWSSIS